MTTKVKGKARMQHGWMFAIGCIGESWSGVYETREDAMAGRLDTVRMVGYQCGPVRRISVPAPAEMGGGE